MSTQTGEIPFDHDDAPTEIRVDALEFRRLVNAVGTIVDECRMHVTPDGIKVSAVDPANVAMVEAETGEVEVDRPVVFGINLNQTVEAVETLDEERPTDWPYNLEIFPDSRVIQFGHSSLDNEVMIFNPEGARDDPTPPEDLDITTEFSVPAYRFKAVVGSVARMVDSYVLLKPADGEVIVEGYDGMMKAGDLSESPPCEWSLEADVEAGGDVIYSAGYLEEITSGLPYEGTVDVSFGTPTPIIVESDLGVTFYQAPRLRPDEVKN